MLGIGTALVGMGLGFVKDLIMDNGEDLVKEGIKKVTGIDLNKKKPQELTAQEITAIKEAEFRLKELDFKTLELDYKARQTAEENITKRWESDSKSDSRIAKMTRPMLVLYLVFVVTLLALLDGNMQGFSIKEHWVSLFTSLTLTAVGGYFALRTYEKRTSTNGWSK